MERKVNTKDRTDKNDLFLYNMTLITMGNDKQKLQTYYNIVIVIVDELTNFTWLYTQLIVSL